MRKENMKLTRRNFLKSAAAGAGLITLGYAGLNAEEEKKRIRLGGPLFVKYKNPDEWVEAVKKWGYRAAICPVQAGASDDVIKAYEEAARKADITIAEVGAWNNNPISPDEKTAKDSIAGCQRQLALADKIGARCCVNVAGSRNPKSWAGDNPENLTKETFDRIVEATRQIIDGVKPTRTYYTLEAMCWVYPYSTESYLELIRAIDRKQFGVHFDPTNLMCSPERFYHCGEVIREFFDKLGPMIRSCHAKDAELEPKALAHLSEVRPGLGGLDYKTFLTELTKYPDVPLILEHLPNAEEYKLAGDHLRTVAASIGATFE
jgi:sugar phosphate isomerase/epimerase